MPPHAFRPRPIATFAILILLWSGSLLLERSLLAQQVLGPSTPDPGIDAVGATQQEADADATSSPDATGAAPAEGPPELLEEPPDREPADAEEPSQEDDLRTPDREEIVERSLRSLIAEREAKKTVLATTRRELEETGSPQRRDELATEASALEAEIRTLDRRVESLVGGIEVRQFYDEPRGDFDLRSEVESLLEVLIRQIKSGTEGPRTIARMRSRIDLLKQLEGLASKAMGNAERERAKQIEQGLTQNDRVVSEINRAIEAWRSRLAETRRERNVLEAELQTKLDSRLSVLESTGRALDTFFRSRGLNLLIGAGAFLAVFFSLRFLQRRMVLRYRAEKERSFLSRAFNVFFYVLTFAASFAALIVALFAVNDWTLLLLVLLFLLGLGWASIRMLPQFVEQIRLLLNLGPVREGERIIFEGLPWKVDTLLLYTRLTNPDLSGGQMRVPIKDLAHLHSRPIARNERWFPTREGDWVVLGDERFGKVEVQTPDMVHLRLLGGSLVTYPSADFLGLHPHNLSEGFRVEITFGIDYAHQSIATTEVPERMRKKIEEGILELVLPEELSRVAVEFSEAGSSSLDYKVLADVNGSAAPRYRRIQRALSSLLVDCCNEQGWTIPFTQVTLHQASSGS